MQIIKILIPKIGLFPLSYQIPFSEVEFEFKIGQLIVVPFRSKEITGIVWEVENNHEIEYKKLKTIEIEQIRFPACLDENQINLIKKTSEYYLSDLGTITKLVLPVDINESPIRIASTPILPDTFDLHKLNEEQEFAIEEIKTTNKPIIIKGVTGSGKTEIYFHMVAEYLRQGKQVLIMLPEIALSTQIFDRFTKRFGFEPIVWNSNVTKANKKKILRGIISGEVLIVIGARSSLFLPYKNLALIVIDEEHDASYKQSEGILYNARDMAVLRSFISNIKILLISATPSIETIYNVILGKYKLIELKTRFKNASLPDIEVVDMREESIGRNSWLSQKLVEAIKINIANKQQTLLFLNRRGYAPLMLCKSCGHRFDCKSCSATMVVHKSTKRMECHHCGAISRIYSECPECYEQGTLILCGPGIERIAEEAQSLFPNSKIAIISRDQANRPGEIISILNQMENGELDILIGTQIITKGYHFPNLTLVGVIDADIGFLGADLRSSERTYQLLHQVGGRAGRAEKNGKVILQSYSPENRVLLALREGQEEEFIRIELDNREVNHMPPFTKMASINFTGKIAEKTLSIAQNFVRTAPKSEAKILGPAEALMSRLAGRYRYRVLIITPKHFNIQKYLKLWLEQIKIPSSVHCKIDIDPYNFF